MSVYDIKNWLEKCKKESASLPVIRETIVQYINLICYLTNQMVKDAMSEEIKEKGGIQLAPPPTTYCDAANQIHEQFLSQ